MSEFRESYSEECVECGKRTRYFITYRRFGWSLDGEWSGAYTYILWYAHHQPRRVSCFHLRNMRLG